MANSDWQAVYYVSDGDTYYDTDFNSFVVGNIDYLHKFASSNAKFERVTYDCEIDLGSFATDFSVNFGDGNRQHATLTGNADVNLLTSDLSGAGNFTLAIDGNFTYAFDSDQVLAPDGTVSFTIASDVEDIVGLYYTDRDSKFRIVVSEDFE